MMADVLGRPIETAPAAEASLRGAALLALEALGKIDGLETLDWPAGEIYEPDFARRRTYAAALERQQKLYEQLISGGDTKA
jgi:gluconokinase